MKAATIDIASLAPAAAGSDRPLAAAVTLDRLLPGDFGRVCGLSGLAAAVAERLLELGFDDGARVEVLHRAPMGDPVAVRVDGSTVALRRALARGVQVIAGR